MWQMLLLPDPLIKFLPFVPRRLQPRAETQYIVLGHTECLICCHIQVSTAVLSITAKAKKKEKEKEKEKKEEEKMEVVGAHIET